MHKFGSWIAAAAALMLAACGGSNSSNFATNGSSSSSSGGTAGAATIQISSSVATIPSDSTSGALIQAMVLDANNNAISNATVTFSSSAGVLENENNVTTATAGADATLVAQGAAVGTVITVTASAGGVSKTITVSVVNNQQTITLLTNLAQIASNGSTPATITAVVRNASNQLVSGVAVNFVTNSGGIAPVQTTAGAAASPVIAAGTTDVNGQAQAALTPAGDPTNRTITVTASVGATTATIAIAVVGTKLALTGPTSLIIGNLGTFTVSLVDSAGDAIAGDTVTASSANGNTLSATTLTTDATGHATFNLTAVKAGADTITVAGLGLTATQTVAVSSQSFTFTVPAANQIVDLNTAQPITLVWASAGIPVTGQPVTFSTTRGLFGNSLPTITSTTDGTGKANAPPVSVSSTTAGPAVISASATGVSAQLALTFVATVPASIDVQASPATVPTNGQSTITAIVRDAQNNLVEGQTIDFQLTDKTNGSISVATATTDVQGKAQTVYTATSTASASNGVVVTATVQGTAIQNTVDLTVGGQTVFLSLGTGSTISENASKTQFTVPFVAQALDSGGNAVAGVAITLTIHSLPPAGPTPVGPNFNVADSYAAYRKGKWVLGNTTPPWAQQITGECPNEDLNGNGVLDPGEDLNDNNALDPGDVAAVSPGTVTTDSTGTANVAVTYPEDHALWVQVKLTATATVSGTQTTTTSVFWLPMLASYLSNSAADPPGLISPYGQNPSCAVAN